MKPKQMVKEPEYSCKKLDRLIVIINMLAESNPEETEEALKLVDELRIINNNLRAWGKQCKAFADTGEVREVKLIDEDVALMLRQRAAKAKNLDTIIKQRFSRKLGIK